MPRSPKETSSPNRRNNPRLVRKKPLDYTVGLRASPGPQPGDSYTPCSSPTERTYSPPKIPQRRASKRIEKMLKPIRDWDETNKGRAALLARRTVSYNPSPRRRRNNELSTQLVEDDPFSAQEQTISDAPSARHQRTVSTASTLSQVDLLILAQHPVLDSQISSSDEDDGDNMEVDFGGFEDSNFDGVFGRPSSPSTSVRSDESTETKIDEELALAPTADNKGKARETPQVVDSIGSCSYQLSNTLYTEDSLLQQAYNLLTSETYKEIRGNLVSRKLCSPSASPEETLSACLQRLQEFDHAESNDLLITPEDRDMARELIDAAVEVGVEGCNLEQSRSSNFRAIADLVPIFGLLGRKVLGHRRA